MKHDHFTKTGLPVSRRGKRLLSLALVLALVFTLLPTAFADNVQEIALTNGDFENGTTGWTLSPGIFNVETDSYATNNETHILDFPYNGTTAVSVSVSYSVSLDAGEYYFTFQMDGDTSSSGLSYGVRSGSTVLAAFDQTIAGSGWDQWQTFTTAHFTLTETKTVTFSIEGSKAIGWWGNLDNLRLFRVAAQQQALSQINIPNGDLESDSANWTLTGYTVTDISSSASHSGHALGFWISNDSQAYGCAQYKVSLTAGEYYFTFDVDGQNGQSGNLSAQVLNGQTALTAALALGANTDWDNWTTYETAHFTLAEPAEVTFQLSGTQPAGFWGHLDDLKLYGTGEIYQADPQDPDAGIYVEKLADVGADGFIRGTDVSSFLSLYNSGAKFYDFDGTLLDQQGFFNLLKDCGFNWVRLRVWNDPYDAQGNGYGGGNNDLDAAVAMGQWATAAGLRVLIDFHYSDFWADPGKQQAPKAWQNYTLNQKVSAVNTFTYNSLDTLLTAGVDVGMVQVGNETTGGICGVTGWDKMAQIFNAGAAAIRQIAAAKNLEIPVALHFTNPETSGKYANIAQNLSTYQVDYDVFATSWYPYWHGTLDNLTSVLKNVADTYGKQVMIAETSWAWTLNDGDGWANTVSHLGNNDVRTWPFSIQGQAAELRAAAKAVLDTGSGLGLFYWENAWIPVEYAYDAQGDKDPAILASNQAKWEQYGSGWAASYGGSYEADSAEWYGGSAVDNQAMFDFHGHPLASLKTFKYMMNGAAQTPVEDVVSIEDPELGLELNGTVTLPGTVAVQYALGGTVNETVVWNAADLAAVDTSVIGVYTVRGTVNVQNVQSPENFITLATIDVHPVNLLADRNFGFESGDFSYYATAAGGSRSTDTPHSGTYGYHFWNENGGTVELSQTLQLEPGRYVFLAYAQGKNYEGTDPQQTYQQYAYVTVGGETLQADFSLDGWKIWLAPTVNFTVTASGSVTLGVHLAYGPGGWGAIDDLTLYKLPDAAPAGQFVMHSLTLKDDIGINFYVDLGETDPADAAVDFRWTVGGVEKTESVALATLQPIAEGEYQGCYKAEVHVAAKEMTDLVTATLTVDGQAVGQSTYSVADYARTILADTAHETYSEPLWSLAKAMLIYGAKSQTAFGYRLDALADEGLASYQLTAPTDLDRASIPALTDFGLRLKASSLVLRSKTTYRLYFEVTDPAKYAALTVTLGETALEFQTKAGSDEVYLDVAGIAAKNLLDPISLTFSNGTKTATATVGVQDYIAAVLRGNDAALRETVIALYDYATAAAAYFLPQAGN